VYKARDTSLDREVAIKIVAEHFSQRFESEAHAIAALNHPYICALHDIGPNYLVMEYMRARLWRHASTKRLLSKTYTSQAGARGLVQWLISGRGLGIEAGRDVTGP